MPGVISGLPELIEQGEQFTYENFASKSTYGFPNALSADWLVWTHRVSEIVDEIEGSTIADSLERGLKESLLGNGDDNFFTAKNSILNGLRAAQKVFGEPAVPASDRIVSIGHNSPEQKQALEKIDQLVEAVKEANDLPGGPEEKEQLIAELSAGRKLLEASVVRVGALRATLQPALRWILEKAAGTIVGKIAIGVWEFFVGLHWL
jgi:hypothetical protein